jgi:hypothetical protein
MRSSTGSDAGSQRTFAEALEPELHLVKQAILVGGVLGRRRVQSISEACARLAGRREELTLSLKKTSLRSRRAFPSRAQSSSTM